MFSTFLLDLTTYLKFTTKILEKCLNNTTEIKFLGLIYINWKVSYCDVLAERLLSDTLIRTYKFIQRHNTEFRIIQSLDFIYCMMTWCLSWCIALWSGEKGNTQQLMPFPRTEHCKCLPTLQTEEKLSSRNVVFLLNNTCDGGEKPFRHRRC
jgi:cellulose synthase/poly-beta-1,6-N-acetylglucosamine synthase-like glycosyltransferase